MTVHFLMFLISLLEFNSYFLCFMILLENLFFNVLSFLFAGNLNTCLLHLLLFQVSVILDLFYTFSHKFLFSQRIGIVFPRQKSVLQSLALNISLTFFQPKRTLDDFMIFSKDYFVFQKDLFVKTQDNFPLNKNGLCFCFFLLIVHQFH